MAKMASGDLSLTSTSSQEEESTEYVGYDNTLRPSSNSSGSTATPKMPNSNNNNNNNGANNVVVTNNNNNSANIKKYDVIKSQYDLALRELSTLRHQHTDTVRRCDDLATKLSFYQAQMAAMNHRNAPGNPTTNSNAYYCDYVTDVVGVPSAALTANHGKCDGQCGVKLLDLDKERSFLALEKEKYKKNYATTVNELDKIKKERNFYRDAREEDCQKLKALLTKEKKNVALITEELNQLLSEKDNVLQEHQKMSDDLALANKDIENLKKDELLFKNEIKALQLANAELKKRDLFNSRDSSWSKDFSDSGKDDYKEIEKLRKSLEKAHSEAERAKYATEEAQRVRDWAISQREKIVQERDSVKTLCDNLRKERDKAISDLLLAIRDSDEIKKQKDEAQKKIDLLKEQIEQQNLDGASRRSFRMSSYEAEDMLEIELCNYYDMTDLGIILDDSNNKQLVCGVTNSSPAFGKLKINDVICKVNNMECQSMSKRMVLEEIRASAPRSTLLVSRTRHSKRHFYTAQLNTCERGQNHGLQLDVGVFIAKIEENSLAAYEPELDVGDRVLSINNKSLEGCQNVDDAMLLLNDARNESISIFALKNVQDVSYSEGRMTSSFAQTDSIDSNIQQSGGGGGSGAGGSGSAKHPFKLAEILRKFKIGKLGTVDDHLAHDAIAALDSVLSDNSSEKSKDNLTKRNKRGKKEKDAAAKSMGTWPRTNILQATHENPTGTIVQRSEKKPALLSLFTAGPINVDKDDDDDVRGVIVGGSAAVGGGNLGVGVGRLPSNEPPPLPPQLSKPQHIRNGVNGSAIKTNPNRNSNPIPASALFHAPTVNNGGVGGIGGPSPNYARHSVYSTAQEPLILEQTKPLQRPTPIMGANFRVKMPGSMDKYAGGGGTRAYNPNRISLNLTPTELYKSSGQQAQQQVINMQSSGDGFPPVVRKQQPFDMFAQPPPPPLPSSSQLKTNALFVPLMSPPQQLLQQQMHGNGASTRSTPAGNHSLDMISLKSQNSIDSILSTKSPPPIINDYVLPSYPKRGMPMPQAAKHVPKYPSDSESIASGIMSAGGGSSVGGGMYQHQHATHPHAIMMPNRHSQLFSNFTPTSTTSNTQHGMRHIRHSSPLTLPSPPPPPASASALLPHASTHAQHDSAIGIPTSSVDKFDMDYVAHLGNQHTHAQHHGHAGSYLNDYAHQSQYHPQPLPHQQQHQPHHHQHTHGLPLSVGVIYEGGTFPRKNKDNQRLRIPSNPSVSSKNSIVKNSSGSIDHHYATATATANAAMMSSAPSPLIHHHAAVVSNSGVNGSGGGSGRGSPMPQVHVEVLSHGGSKRNSNVPADFLCPGDLRRVTIDKSDKSLGITIQCNNNGGGIFVSTVADKSIATRAGLQVGDQLLEVCGLNMRSATNDIAANVLRQCGNSITMLVQYNPEKFHSAEYDGTHNLEPESPVNHSGSPTPRNSPRPPARNMLATLPPVPLPTASMVSSRAPSNVMMPQSNSLMSQQSIKDQSFADSLENQSDLSSSQDIPSSAATTTTTTASATSTVYDDDSKSTAETLRYVTLHMDKSKNLGIKLFGGNKVGIFVHDVAPVSPSDHAGIRKGDQILEYNGVDLRGVTAEQAANEISKLTDTVTMLVQNRLQTLKQIKDKPGDSFYVRVGFDRTGELNEDDLRFVKDEVLYVDNTVFNGTFGLWRAWKLDAMGHRKECGIIPSQMKVEEELRSGEVVDCDTGTARRGSTTARRSFFRRKKHQRSSSRDSTEIASFSNTQLSFFPDSGILNDDGCILSYQRVELLDSPIRRPVLIIGPLSECVMDRLIIDFSNLFKLCEVTAMDCSQEAMEESLQQNIFVDYRRRGNKYECTAVEAISNACKNDRRHCILDVSISAVERLQRLQIYPIVLLLRFKSAKQIREIRDFGTDKISAKAAKEMYERALKLETDYKQYISAVIPGVSIKHMCTQIKDAVDKEQDKLLWVPVANS